MDVHLQTSRPLGRTSNRLGAPKNALTAFGSAMSPRWPRSVIPAHPPRSKERDGIEGVGLTTTPSSPSSPQPTSALRRTLRPASGRPRSSGELVSAPRLGRCVPKNASARLGDASKLTSAWRGYPAHRSRIARRRTTLPGFCPLRRLQYRQRPTSGFPHPTVLRLQAFSAS